MNRNSASPSAARALTQGTALQNPAGRRPKQGGRIARFFAEPERQIGILEYERHAIVNRRHVGAWFNGSFPRLRKERQVAKGLLWSPHRAMCQRRRDFAAAGRSKCSANASNKEPVIGRRG